MQWKITCKISVKLSIKSVPTMTTIWNLNTFIFFFPFFFLFPNHFPCRKSAITAFSTQELTFTQWRNRQGGRGQSAPPDFWPGNFCWRIGKNKERKKGKRGENWEEKKENCYEKRWGPIWFGSTKMEIFYQEKNQEKWLCPLRKICLLHPCIYQPEFKCKAICSTRNIFYKF